MKHFWQIHNIILIVLLCSLKIYTFASSSTSGSYPFKPVHVVVPYSAGGGTDSFTRLITKGITDNELLPQPTVIINQPGGNGTIASRDVKESKADGYKILCHHEALLTAKLSGAVPYGSEAFIPIAQTGEIVLLVVVREDSPFKSIRDLLEEAKQSPSTLRFGADIGSPAHFTAMSLEAAYPGSKLNLITVGGGQKRYLNIIGGHLEAGIFSLAEFISFVSPEGTPPDKNIRVLALLSEKPHPALPGVRTCLQEDIDVTSSNAYYWWAPKGTPSTVVETLAVALENAMKDKNVQAKLNEWSVEGTFSKGEVVKKRLEGRLKILEPLAVKAENKLPNFPLYTGIIILALASFVVFDSFRNRTEKSDDENEFTPRIWLAGICFVVLTAYITVLQFAIIPFAFATILMIFILGGLIVKWDSKKLITLAQIALITGLGSEFIFTRIFTVILP